MKSGDLNRHRRWSNIGVGRAGQVWFAIMAMVAICALSALAYAKVVAGISGIVTDSSGAVVAGATVTARATDTGIVTTRQTNSMGFYAFVDLAPGHYNIEVQQPGFGMFRQSGIVLDVDSAKVINIK